MNDPIISKNGGDQTADPEVALRIPVYRKGSIIARRSRALVGWSHQNDTSDGRRTGKIWCWVSDGGQHFQVYDEHFNRSRIAQEVRFCGVANFTMVRMFHPYWAKTNGEAPRDMNRSDKRYCRRRYQQLIRRHNQAAGHPVTDQSSDDDSDHDEMRRKRRRAPKRSTGRRRNAPKARHTRKLSSPRDSRGSRPTSSENDRWAVPDGSDDSSSDSAAPLANRKRPKLKPDTDDEERDLDFNDTPIRHIRTPAINRNPPHDSSASPARYRHQSVAVAPGVSSLFVDAGAGSENGELFDNTHTEDTTPKMPPDSQAGTATYSGITVAALPTLGSASPRRKVIWGIRRGELWLQSDGTITISDDEENDETVEENEKATGENEKFTEEIEKAAKEEEKTTEEQDKDVDAEIADELVLI